MMTEEGRVVIVKSEEQRIAAELETDFGADELSDTPEEIDDHDDEVLAYEKKKAEARARESEEGKPTAGRTSAHADDAVITVLRAENPKMEGSDSHRRCALLRSGGTVAEDLRDAGPRARRRRHS